MDGFPRDVEQATAFEEHIGRCSRILFYGTVLTKLSNEKTTFQIVVIFSELSDDTMRERLLKRGLSSGRVDDNEATIQRRLRTFHRESEPVVAAYEDICVRVCAAF